MPSGPRPDPDPAYHADIEPLTACLRVFQSGESPGRDPFERAGTLLWHDRETVEVKGARLEYGDQPMLMRSAVFAALREHGIKTVLMQRRRRDGSSRLARLRLDRFQPTE